MKIQEELRALTFETSSSRSRAIMSIAADRIDELEAEAAKHPKVDAVLETAGRAFSERNDLLAQLSALQSRVSEMEALLVAVDAKLPDQRSIDQNMKYDEGAGLGVYLKPSLCQSIRTAARSRANLSASDARVQR